MATAQLECAVADQLVRSSYLLYKAGHVAAGGLTDVLWFYTFPIMYATFMACKVRLTPINVSGVCACFHAHNGAATDAQIPHLDEVKS
jgi:hypothetical protein